MPPSHTPNPDPSYSTVHGPLANARWLVRVIADPSPLLLPRVLQKLAVPSIELRAVRYTTNSPTKPAELEIEIETSKAWVELTGAKIGKLIGIRQITTDSLKSQKAD